MKEVGDSTSITGRIQYTTATRCNQRAAVLYVEKVQQPDLKLCYLSLFVRVL